MSSNPLLRLFESEHFNVHLAVSYLKTYSSSIGVTFYLVNRLAQFPESELEFYWPQLCHLLITTQSESAALEGFILTKCEESIHLAMLTLWQLQASLSDLSSNPSTPQFAICRRVYNRVQHIIFSDPLLESAADAVSARQRLGPGDKAVQAAVAGMSVLLASLGLPQLAGFSGRMAIEQGKRSRGAANQQSQQGSMQGKSTSPDIGPDNSESEDEMLNQSGPVASTSRKPMGADSQGFKTPRNTAAGDGIGDSAEKTAKKSAVAQRRKGSPSKRAASGPSYLPGAPIPVVREGYVPTPRSPVSVASVSARRHPRQASNPSTARGKRSVELTTAHTKIAHSYSMTSLPSPTAGNFSEAAQESSEPPSPRSQSPRVTFQPPSRSSSGRHIAQIAAGGNLSEVSQRLAESPPLQRHSVSDNRSTKSSPSLHRPYASSTSNLISSSHVSFDIPPHILSLMLRSYACRSQLDLLTSLQDIATRLVVVPKMARLSSLRAELTVLNHGLPRGCCLLMGCSGKGGGGSHARQSQSVSSFPETSEAIYTAAARPQVHAHQRIVRISPSESVVLNSADRAPFLIHVEVLEDDLDFDSARRQNSEDVRAVMSERDGSFKNRARTPDTQLLSNGSSQTAKSPDIIEPVSLNVQPNLSRTTSGASSFDLPGTRTPEYRRGISEVGNNSVVQDPEADPKVSENEEVDLVEQLYGSFSVHDTSDIELPDYRPEIHNRSVDEAAWRRAEARRSFQLESGKNIADALVSRSSASPPSAKMPRRVLTIDEYAERMRMAAIMLAQLNASQQLPMSGTDAVTGVVGAGLALPVHLTYGVGSVVGSVVNVGVDVVRASFGSRRDSTGAVADALAKSSSEQASSGFHAQLDVNSAASGLSTVSGSINPATLPEGVRPSPIRTAPGSRSPSLGSNSTFSPSASTPSSSSSVHPQNQQRQRVLSIQEATMIRERIMSEMMALEEERMARMRATSQRSRFNSGRALPGSSSAANGIQPETGREEESIVMRAVNKDDPSGAVFQESWADKKSRIRAASPFGHLANWDVFSVIVKTGADLRQEQLAVQLIKEFGRIWTETQCPHWIRYFRILVTSESTGLVETITDAVSVHSIKKEAYAKIAANMAATSSLHSSQQGEQANGTSYLPSFTLYDHFLATFGPAGSASYRKAQDAFCRSLASYSIISYLLQIKDRHNGNILVDKAGHVVHIDFGFMLSNSPGSLGFEMAPFKLTQDYIDILGGMGSAKWDEYRNLMKRQFRDVRGHADRITTLVSLMQTDSRLPCFNSGGSTGQLLRDRFQLALSTSQLDDFVDRLIISSAGSAFTRLYDTFQRPSQGVL